MHIDQNHFSENKNILEHFVFKQKKTYLISKMKIAFWLMFCAHVMSRISALDCEDTVCMNKLCPLMKSPVVGQNMFKCPHDNYCMQLDGPGTENTACFYCPQGGNEKMCREICSSIPDTTPCDSNVTKCYSNRLDHCDGVDDCPNKSDE